MYDKYSMKAEEFIDDGEIRASIAWAEENKTNLELVNQLIDKTDELKGLSHREALLLLLCEDKDAIQRIFKQAEKILTEQAANVYLQDLADMVAINKNLTGFQFYPLYVLDLSGLAYVN